MSKKKEENKKGIENLDIKINELGEISSNMRMDKINSFLDKNLNDKKLKNLSEEE